MIRRGLMAIIGAALVWAGVVLGRVSLARQVFDTGRLAQLEARVAKVEALQTEGFRRELGYKLVLGQIMGALRDIYSRFGEPVEG